jgi:hypothetical protein
MNEWLAVDNKPERVLCNENQAYQSLKFLKIILSSKLESRILEFKVIIIISGNCISYNLIKTRYISPLVRYKDSPVI